MDPYLAIFNYHGFGKYEWAAEEKPYVLAKETFADHLNFLKGKRIPILSSSGLGEWLYGRNAGMSAAVLTFDDGLLSHYEIAAPLLKERQMKGIFFVSAGLVEKKGMMGWTQLRELLEMGFDIGSHGYRHVPLTGLNPKELEEEFRRSKQLLEDKLGYSIDSFSIPRGFYKESFHALAQQCGYRFMFTSQYNFNYPQEDALCLKRFAIKRSTSFSAFRSLATGKLGMARYIERAKENLRGSISSGFYDRLAAAKRRVFSYD